MYADDDNWYEPHALHLVRTTVQHDLDGLYIFQMRDAAIGGRVIPDFSNNGEVEPGNVDTGEASALDCNHTNAVQAPGTPYCIED